MQERTRQHTPSGRDPASPASDLALAGVWRAAALIMALTVAVLSLMPSPPTPPGFLAWDKAQHALAYAVLAWWWLQCWPRQGRWILLGLIGFGVGLEGVQAVAPQRMLEMGDMLANAIGVVAGAGVLRWRALHLVGALDRLATGQAPWRD